jgi:hypothetical protein
MLADHLPPRQNRGRKPAKNEGVDFTLLERCVGKDLGAEFNKLDKDGNGELDTKELLQSRLSVQH